MYSKEYFFFTIAVSEQWETAEYDSDKRQRETDARNL